MTTWNILAYTLVLGLYYLDKDKDLETFTNKFNKYFSLDVSAQTILFELTKIKNIDPVNNTKSPKIDSEYHHLWKHYIQQGNIKLLKAIYRSFKNSKYIEKLSIHDDESIEDINFSNISSTIIDQPVTPPDDYRNLGLSAYKRHQQIAANSLKNANFLCEAMCNTKLFIRRNSLYTYTEAHHLIPLCFQSSFKYSLDVEANIVSLCPNCHRLLHYGRDNYSLLVQLYNLRENRLKKCGLAINQEDLLFMYR